MTHRRGFYTVPEAAKKFGVNRKTMSGWVSAGKIKAIVTPGGHRRILCSEIDALVEKNGFSKAAASQKNQILIVDDDEAVRKTLKRHLEHAGFSVHTASDGFKAGLTARDVRPALIMLDLMMDGIDGFEVCRTIKADISLKDTKVMILTGYDTPDNRKKAFQEGADAFIAKGILFETLLKRINDLLVL